MLDFIINWYNKRFSDPDAITLALILAFIFIGLIVLGDILAPVIVALVIAYLLEWPITHLVRLGVRRSLAVGAVMILFVFICTLSLLGLTPLIWHQLINLTGEIPNIIQQGQNYLLNIPEYQQVIKEEQIKAITASVNNQVVESSKTLVTASLNSIVTIVTLLIYLVLVPLLVFFMLADKETLLRQVMFIMPNKRRLAVKVWAEMNQQIGNYIQGKVFEILIVGSISVIAFLLLDLRYAVLLGVAVGFSVLIPYIGAAVVTVPVAVVALFQFGVSPEFWYVMIVYGIIQAIDGNVIVPILFSQAVNLHPVFIIIAVLFFGGVWGFWGVFFAIPLATLVKAVINAWPKHSQIDALDTNTL
ncbi:AI-2E family transporter [Catenovulum sp. 2E275]|uniref:AI-2E family transporter n=1 Tax=Catenovulum sp. 2E275 TaxID=2980497 RepID=UPI0021CEF25B|nr:AI-2E family transporter [Catenovulum sp. 2E275]MCU4676488.1 AI-2E family transporter [Catenovulum sp. 2E275]